MVLSHPTALEKPQSYLSSKRSIQRWKKRCREGYAIPAWALRKYQLSRWFKFTATDHAGPFTAFAEATGEVITRWQLWDQDLGKNPDPNNVYVEDPSGVLLRTPKVQP